MWRSVATSSSVPGETGIPARGGGRIGRKGGKGEERGVCACVCIYIYMEWKKNGRWRRKMKERICGGRWRATDKGKKVGERTFGTCSRTKSNFGPTAKLSYFLRNMHAQLRPCFSPFAPSFLPSFPPCPPPPPSLIAIRESWNFPAFPFSRDEAKKSIKFPVSLPNCRHLANLERRVQSRRRFQIRIIK